MIWLILSLCLSFISVTIIGGIIWYHNQHTKQGNKYSYTKCLFGLCWLLLSVFGLFCSVKTGHVGVVSVFGNVGEKYFDAGLHVKLWWEKVVQIDIQNQKQSCEMNVYSKDIQEVSVNCSINYKVYGANANKIYKEVGVEYYEKIVQPRVQEIVKSVISKYTAETLVNNRDELSQKIFEKLSDEMTIYNICIISANVEDIDFSEAFTIAVEEKQVASQQKQKAIIEQEQKTVEQEQQSQRDKIKAEMEAEIRKIQAEADMLVVQIEADSAEYQGKKDASIKLQKLIALNGYHLSDDGTTILDSENNVVNSNDLKIATQNLLLQEYIEQWSGELPSTYIGSNDFVEIFKSILAS